ncbi:hypothetical protein ICM05_00145 [Leucobacter sp. cx-42]|uniref:hypothetical protein n=1 Tax=unclassified Leucobacter TaxID=2621730 RepID=UPI00165E2DEC|nr:MULTISPECIES: hypothetical protein [unclassified Leucobacter]MBC9953057.1 hypothetical protein [Leucobacter sp. cx-42]
MKRFTQALVIGSAVALSLGLAGCTKSEPETPQVKLSVSEAAAQYLDAVCPVNSAWDAADSEIDRLRIAVARGEGVVDTRLYADAISQVGEVSGKAATQLTSADVVWPAAAGPLVVKVASSLKADAKTAPTAAKLEAEQAVNYEWPGATQAGTAAAAVREALGLPDDAVAACDARAEQIAEERAAEKAEQAKQAEQADSAGTGAPAEKNEDKSK